MLEWWGLYVVVLGRQAVVGVVCLGGGEDEVMVTEL